MLSGIRLLARSIRLTWHLLLGALLACTLRTLGGPDWHISKAGGSVIVWWTHALNRIIGLRIKTHGEPASGMLVANHVSWLDIVALGARRHTHFVSKDDVRNWPMIGLLARLSGTIFIRRHSPAALKASLAGINNLLAAGQSVAFFPEGTTSNGEHVLPFRPALMQAAVGGKIQPVALRYVREHRLDTVAPFIGDDEFVPHLLRLLREPETCVELHYLPPLEQHELTRAELAAYCRHAIQEILNDGCWSVRDEAVNNAICPQETLAVQEV